MPQNEVGASLNLEISLTQKFAYVTGTSKVEYVGKAKTGTATSASGWQIQKLTYDGNNVTDIKWASGDAKFDKIWDSRTGYTYS